MERRLAPQYRMTVADHDLELVQQAALRAAAEMRSEDHILREAKRSPAGRGSTACTSRPAPAIVPALSASYSASSSTSPPRLVLTKKALGRMAAKSERLAKPAFSGMLETFNDTKSERPSRSPSSTKLAPVAASCPGVARLRLV